MEQDTRRAEHAMEHAGTARRETSLRALAESVLREVRGDATTEHAVEQAGTTLFHDVEPHPQPLERVEQGDPRAPYDPFLDPRPALPEVRAVWSLMEAAEDVGCILVRSGPFASVQRRDGALREVPRELVDRLHRLSIGAVVRALTRKP